MNKKLLKTLLLLRSAKGQEIAEWAFVVAAISLLVIGGFLIWGDHFERIIHNVINALKTVHE